MYVSETDPHLEQALALGPGRQAYLVCIEGELVVHGPKGESAALVARDAADLVAPASKEALHLTLVSGAKGAHFMIIEMSQRPVLGGLG